MDDLAILGTVLWRFIEHNLTDHGYVCFLEPDLILDGRVPISPREAEAIRRVMGDG